MTEWERMVAGKIYFPGDDSLLEARQRARPQPRQNPTRYISPYQWICMLPMEKATGLIWG